MQELICNIEFDKEDDEFVAKLRTEMGGAQGVQRSHIRGGSEHGDDRTAGRILLMCEVLNPSLYVIIMPKLYFLKIHNT